MTSRTFLMLLIAGLAGAPAFAQVPPQQTAAIAARALGYVRGLEGDGEGAIVVVVVAASLDNDAFAALRGVQLRGRPLRIEVVAPTDGDVAKTVRAHSPAAVFVDARPETVPALARLADEQHFLLIVTERPLLDQGAHLAIADLGGRPRLIVSLAAMKRAGVEMAPELLGHAVVVR